MIIARGKNTYIMDLERKHVDEMQSWGEHRDPLFTPYNFPKMDKQYADYWYSVKKHSLTKKCYVVYNNNHQLVGYISLRNIKWIRRQSELGIVFNPDCLEQGYGTDSLEAFIQYYFEKMKMKKLYLRVAIFNKRAQRCYEKVGFKPIKVQYDEFEDQKMPIFSDNTFILYRHFFRLEGTQLQCKFVHMWITRDYFRKNK